MRHIGILGLIGLIFAQGCFLKNDEKLVGHWHRASINEWGYQTIDIEDTLTITDKYCLYGVDYYKYLRIDGLGRHVLPSSDFRVSHVFTLRDDTLAIHDSIWTHKYVRKNINECLISDRYANCPLSISLPNSYSADNFEDFNSKICSDDLFIGRLKPGTEFSRLLKAYPDSIFISRADIYLGIEHVPELCKYLIGVCTEDNGNLLNLNLHADISVPNDFLKRIESFVPAEFSIHRVVNSGTGDIGLSKLR